MAPPAAVSPVGNDSTATAVADAILDITIFWPMISPKCHLIQLADHTVTA
jgi:hypothetical protein